MHRLLGCWICLGLGCGAPLIPSEADDVESGGEGSSSSTGSTSVVVEPGDSSSSSSSGGSTSTGIDLGSDSSSESGVGDWATSSSSGSGSSSGTTGSTGDDVMTTGPKFDLPPGAEESSSTGEPTMTTGVLPTSLTLATSGAEESSSGGAVGDADLGDGERCDSDDACLSGACFELPVVGGLCGECRNEDDCELGCHAPDWLEEPAIGSYCDDGTLGAGCDTDAGCLNGLRCVDVLDVMELDGCSECAADADCMGECAPVYDNLFTDFEGYWACVGAGTLPLGAGCDPDGNGEECASGVCGRASLQGLTHLGICSECDFGVPCPVGEFCSIPAADFDGTWAPGTCE